MMISGLRFLRVDSTSVRLVISSILGSIAAACECEYNGNLAITPEQIITKTNLIEESSSYKIK